MPAKNIMHSDYGADLLQSYNSMSRCAQAVAQAIADEADDYQVVVPAFGESVADTQSQEARREAIRAMTQLHFPLESDPPLVPGGILCASLSTTDLIGHFNAAKNRSGSWFCLFALPSTAKKLLPKLVKAVVLRLCGTYYATLR